VELHGGVEIERVVVRHAGADVGQVPYRHGADGSQPPVPVEKVEMVASILLLPAIPAASPCRSHGRQLDQAPATGSEKWQEERLAIATQIPG
jgi:hypothetical protein